jgi:hypothetical protein
MKKRSNKIKPKRLTLLYKLFGSPKNYIELIKNSNFEDTICFNGDSECPKLKPNNKPNEDRGNNQ